MQSGQLANQMKSKTKTWTKNKKLRYGKGVMIEKTESKTGEDQPTRDRKRQSLRM